ncbi:Uncharacterised protein [Klebsiella pneumoniae]|uniref:Uncharacterized protein n=1 Tax=Klebsiella pneumoniae TaxID=573 RepID=A0A377X9V3_KLEPN|nr:Uncharacterised protein [Klebsiella pneumoniae]
MKIWYICPDRATQVRVQRAILSVDEIVNPQTGEARKTRSWIVNGCLRALNL